MGLGNERVALHGVGMDPLFVRAAVADQQLFVHARVGADQQQLLLGTPNQTHPPVKRPPASTPRPGCRGIGGVQRFEREGTNARACSSGGLTIAVERI